MAIINVLREIFFENPEDVGSTDTSGLNKESASPPPDDDVGFHQETEATPMAVTMNVDEEAHRIITNAETATGDLPVDGIAIIQTAVETVDKVGSAQENPAMVASFVATLAMNAGISVDNVVQDGSNRVQNIQQAIKVIDSDAKKVQEKTTQKCAQLNQQIATAGETFNQTCEQAEAKKDENLKDAKQVLEESTKAAEEMYKQALADAEQHYKDMCAEAQTEYEQTCSAAQTEYEQTRSAAQTEIAGAVESADQCRALAAAVEQEGTQRIAKIQELLKFVTDDGGTV